MVLSSSRPQSSQLRDYTELENYTVIVELPKLTVLYRMDLDKVIPISTHPNALEIFNVSVFKMRNCQFDLQKCSGTADVEIELFSRNLAGYSKQSNGYYPNAQIRLYQIRASQNF
ncbi:hypothetical protein [Acaryochloris sp. IP29b_bin.137]|uniref:hypothetical protein n=1 Tax=Acaryochloris sp. IP29b_bin.137 TaxID=2969217 RepID=UPI00261B8013|nr:hypothetical protein [Acaryochloris sp. IP29b_bin.137]